MWRQVTREDFTATLSEKEIRVFGQNENYDESTVDKQIANTVSAVRGFVRSGRKCLMPDDPALLPEMLVAPAMDLAAFNLIKRFNRVPNDARTKAYERAQALFEKVAAGTIVPEDYGEKPGDVVPDKLTPIPKIRRRDRVLGRVQEEGI